LIVENGGPALLYRLRPEREYIFFKTTVTPPCVTQFVSILLNPLEGYQNK